MLHYWKQRIARPFFMLYVACLLSIFASAFSIHGTTFAAKASQHAIEARNATCQTTQIVLHGQNSPTISCLDQQIASQSVTPQTTTEVCGNNGNDLVLYWNGPLYAPNVIPPGPILCVWGSGDLDLAAGTLNGLNWNDQASAWWAGCSSGSFHQNDGILSNLARTVQDFTGGSGKNADSDNFTTGYVPNDSLTLIHLDSDCH